MQREAIEDQETQTIAARYRDFKVAFDRNQLDSALGEYAPNLLPSGTAPSASDAPREWVFSEFNFPEDSGKYPNTSLLCHMIGDDATGLSIGAIHNYASGRVRPQTEDPNIPESGLQNAFDYVFDYGGEAGDSIIDMTTQNDAPPYYNGVDKSEQEYYPGGKNYRPGWNDWSIATTSVYSFPARS